MTLEEPIVDEAPSLTSDIESENKNNVKNSTEGTTMQTAKHTENINKTQKDSVKNTTTMQTEKTVKTTKNQNDTAPKQLTKDIKQKPKDNEFERNQNNNDSIKNDVEYGIRKHVLN